MFNRVKIVVEHAGDYLFSSPNFYQFYLVAVKGVVTAELDGVLYVEEDEDPPQLSVPAGNAIASEGGSLTWNLQLTVPTTGLEFFYYIVPPTSGTELTSQDVPAAWLTVMGVVPLPSTAVNLSQLGIYSGFTFGYGATTAQITIPLINDGKRENDEVVMIELIVNDVDPENVVSIFLTGTVLAH